ncbi:MAG: pyrrolo-quinoline quinone [Acidiphilium sp. 37-64-53]|uniref:pyrroloquinoline quinone-dependent dehydrogenase n=1 Tax=Acidiphilium TaxID=522 RepID=UPI000BD52477|nr:MULTISPECIES: PQQ-binding-like beta-propeller repeat protein [Acidiphilium]OYW02132.1 MAG: pyrrolo-quinoline quinone [Acidiphilium sp. 37-64-53]OZB25184.1 MAG: pyrrolo-quinoline quinone [Acidiphilium sp. 34-64-41]HQT84077.1 PQQ-binding-like beta-propeller repeat protein [Acidiphilium rubrum]
MEKTRTHRRKRAIMAGIAGAALAIGLGGLAYAGAMANTTTPTLKDYASTQGDHSNWILPAKNYNNDRYVDLSDITPANVAQLKPAWTFKIDDNGPIEAAPIIWHGTAYISSAHDHVYAIDVKTGKLKWQYSDNPHVIAFAANRGIALLDGKVYIATLDGKLVALDANTGKVVFSKLLVKDPANSFYTMAPLPYKDPKTGKAMLILGVSNGDWGGIGNVAAYNPTNGNELWQWNAVPGPGEKGHSTWSGDSWKRGGGAVWTMMAIDPKTDMLYANAGNPQPDFNGPARKGSNLYSDSLVALNISGAKPKLVWYHQFIPHDTHDWDPVMPPVLFNGKVDGKMMPLVADGDKAGNFWLLNSKTGALVNHLQVSMQYHQKLAPSLKGNVACPNTNGGVEYNGGTYDPKTNMIYLPSSNECGFWKSTKSVVYIAGQFYLGGAFPTFVGQNTGQLNAIDVSNGVFAWRKPEKLPMAGGALSTSTGLVFTGMENGDFAAFDATSAKKLWSYDTGSPIIAPPVAFTDGGTEYVAVASGPAGNQQLPTMPKDNKGTMLTMFALPK